MYNYNFECTYKDVEKKYLGKVLTKKTDAQPTDTTKVCDGDNDDECEDDIYFMCEEIYRIEFLKCFNLVEFNDDIINAHVKELFELCKDNITFKHVINLVKTKLKEEDIEICFMQLFAYDLFFYTHNCIKQIKNDMEIDKKVLQKLQNNINYLK